jgi:ATP-dependent RNA helicase RhlE
LAGEAISLVAPTDLEALAAIERLIKKKLDRVLVPGFQPDGGTAATLLGKEARAPSRRESAPREAAPRPMAPRPPRPMAPNPQRPQGDPIFSTPYEPSAASNSEGPKVETAQSPSRRRQPQVAALLGGLKRA